MEGLNVVPLSGGVAAAGLESNRFFDDENFQDALTHLLVYERKTLEDCAHLLSPDDFKPLRGMKYGRPRWIVAERALEHYQKHHEPIGRLLRADVLEYANGISLGERSVAELKEYCAHLALLKPSASDSITDKVVRFKREKLRAMAVQALVERMSAGRPMTDEEWDEICGKGRVAQQETETPPGAQWPEPLKPEAFFGLAGNIVRAIEPHTEADPAALMMQTLATFSNVIGPGPHWMHGATRHALNLFVGIVGPTGAGKGSGLDQVRAMFRDVDPNWSSNPNTYAGLASGEGFIYMVRDPSTRRKGRGIIVADPGVEDKRLLLIQPEFAQVLEVCERQGNTLATKLRNAWDGKPLANNSLSSHLTATGAHISLIVHSTEDDLRDLMRRTMILNGFGNRFLWVCSRRARSLPFGGVVPVKERTALVDRLREAVDFARGLKKGPQRGRMFFEKPAASNLWVSAYRTTLTRESENPVTGRAMPQVRRMACIYALMDCSEPVREEHLRAALETWRYCADSARFIFGGVSRTDPVAEKALDALRHTGRKGLTRKEIYADVFQGNKVAQEITRMLENLRKQGRVRMRTEAAGAQGGRPAERWFAV